MWRDTNERPANPLVLITLQVAFGMAGAALYAYQMLVPSGNGLIIPFFGMLGALSCFGMAVRLAFKPIQRRLGFYGTGTLWFGITWLLWVGLIRLLPSLLPIIGWIGIPQGATFTPMVLLMLALWSMGPALDLTLKAMLVKYQERPPRIPRPPRSGGGAQGSKW